MLCHGFTRNIAFESVVMNWSGLRWFRMFNMRLPICRMMKTATSRCKLQNRRAKASRRSRKSRLRRASKWGYRKFPRNLATASLNTFWSNTTVLRVTAGMRRQLKTTALIELMTAMTAGSGASEMTTMTTVAAAAAAVRREPVTPNSKPKFCEFVFLASLWPAMKQCLLRDVLVPHESAMLRENYSSHVLRLLWQCFFVVTSWKDVGGQNIDFSQPPCNGAIVILVVSAVCNIDAVQLDLEFNLELRHVMLC